MCRLSRSIFFLTFLCFATLPMLFQRCFWFQQFATPIRSISIRLQLIDVVANHFCVWSVRHNRDKYTVESIYLSDLAIPLQILLLISIAFLISSLSAILGDLCVIKYCAFNCHIISTSVSCMHKFHAQLCFSSFVILRGTKEGTIVDLLSANVQKNVQNIQKNVLEIICRNNRNASVLFCDNIQCVRKMMINIAGCWWNSHLIKIYKDFNYIADVSIFIRILFLSTILERWILICDEIPQMWIWNWTRSWKMCMFCFDAILRWINQFIQ